MPTICLSLPLPGLGVASRALWPVWRDSTRKEVRFQPLPKRQAVKLYHHARRLERQTRARNRQDGVMTENSHRRTLSEKESSIRVLRNLWIGCARFW